VHIYVPEDCKILPNFESSPLSLSLLQLGAGVHDAKVKADKLVMQLHGAHQLSVDVLAHVLHYVPDWQRVTCALVSRGWAAAAVLATTELNWPVSAKRAALFQSWLDKLAAQLVSLDLVGECRTLQLQLPLAQLHRLEKLDLAGFTLQLPAAVSPASSSSSGSGSSRLPSLKELCLFDCSVADQHALGQLASSTALTKLILNGVSYNGGLEGVTRGLEARAGGVPTLLEGAPQLVVLHMRNMPLTDTVLWHIAALTRLQDLELVVPEDIAAPCEALEGLPSSLTRLSVMDNRGPFHPSKHTSPSLPGRMQHLQGLLHMEVKYGTVLPGLLASFPRLQHLHLEDCQLLPRDAEDVYCCAGTWALLDVLPSMTQLQHLHLALPQLDIVAPPPERFAALTASSQLTHLAVFPEFGVPLPKKAVQHMFPAGRVMPQLQSLAIGADHNYDNLPEDCCCMADEDLASIFRCCPALHILNIREAMEPNSWLSESPALLQLPQSCVELEVGGLAFDNVAAVWVAQLTQLTSLTWWPAPDLSDKGVEFLTKLPLRKLDVLFCSGLSKELVGPSQADEEYKTLKLQGKEEVSLPECCRLH